jgi:hypothetical protein
MTGGVKLKKCIIMQFLRRKARKVHYSAVFDGGKNRKSSSCRVRREVEKRAEEVERGDSSLRRPRWDGA